MGSDRRNRAFHYAVLASLALHALLFVAFPDLIDSARRAARIPPQIIARLMAPEPPSPAPAPAPEPQKTPKPVERKTAPKPAPVLSTPQPAPVPAPPAEAPIAAAPPPQPAVAAPETPASSEIQASASPQPAPSESLSRDQYRLQLIDEARRHKRYPPLARENNWQGGVLVGVAVGANGRAVVTLKGSSGYEVLDRQAIDMFRQAARAVQVPPTLLGKEFALEVRAVYGLED